MNTTPNSDPPSSGSPADDAASRKSSGGTSGKGKSPQQPDEARAKTDEESRPDDLPEREPLTPELVEDEALRGDFMMRWAMVLLALLIACTTISETETLVHVKSGQYTLEHLLPARTGIFSASAEDRPWNNLSWLFDVLLAAVYAIGGGIGLSVVKALIAATIFGFLVHTSRNGVSTWWGTICAGLALLVSHRQLTARPEIVTLLGLAVTLFLLQRWREQRASKYLKWLVAVFLLWSNMDPGMFYGLAAIVLYGLGETAGTWLGYSGLDSDADRKKLWLAVAGCVAVTLLNPFAWNALLAPVARYATEYPALRGFHADLRGFPSLQYYPIWQPEFWTTLSAAEVAALVLAGTALVTFVLNFRRLDFGDFVMWAGFVSLAALTTHELAAAAIVCAALATVNAQQWYQHTFRQTYSVETSELLFSRGGRVVTVLAMFGLAYLSVSGVGGWLQRRTGIGLDADLQGSIDSFETQLQDVTDDRVFNFVPWQGDVLIWIGKKPFLDNRLALYSGKGEENLIAAYKRCRDDLLKDDKAGEARRRWKATLDRFHVSHAVPRLDSRVTNSPVNYRVFWALANSEDWQLSRVGATAAVFVRIDAGSSGAGSSATKKPFDFGKQAFRTASDDPPMRNDWARQPNLIERWLSRPRGTTPNAVERAKNYLHLLDASSEAFTRLASQRLSQRGGDDVTLALAARSVSLAHLVIRNANAGLDIDAQNAEAYRVLGRAYFYLEGVETWLLYQSAAARSSDPQLAAQLNSAVVAVRDRRYRQSVAALNQSLVIAPDNLETLRFLRQVQLTNAKLDLAADSYRRWLELIEDRKATDRSEALSQKQLRDLKEQRRKLDRHVREVRKRAATVTSSLKSDAASRGDRYAVAQWALQQGCVKLALEVVEEDSDFRSQDPRAALFVINLRQLSGDPERAYDELDQVPPGKDDLGFNDTRGLLEAYSALSRANYVRAVALWNELADTVDRQMRNRFQSVFDTSPLSARSPAAFGSGLRGRPDGGWAISHAAALHHAMIAVPFKVSQLRFHAALSELESGNPQKALATLRKIVETTPDSPVARPAAFYLWLLTGEKSYLSQPAVKVPPAQKPKSKAANAGKAAPRRKPKLKN